MKPHQLILIGLGVSTVSGLLMYVTLPRFERLLDRFFEWRSRSPRYQRKVEKQWRDAEAKSKAEFERDFPEVD